jgi:beta-lactamase superfamily II metal-dependent hydrolase
MATKQQDPPVSVRMFRQGLGDCFLLTIGGTKPRHILIDCGMWEATAPRRGLLQRCVAEIARIAGTLDMLVVTHEHWDHVSGFSQCRDQFEKLPFRKLVMGWTEDPADAVAIAIRRKLHGLRVGIARALGAAHSAGIALSGLDPSILDINGVTPDLLKTGELGAADLGAYLASNLGTANLGVANSPALALAWLKERADAAPETQIECPRPGHVLEDIPGIRIYVLGPPRNEAELRKAEGGVRAKRAGESYLHMDAADAMESELAAGTTFSLAAAERRVRGIHNDDDDGLPFRHNYGMALHANGSIGGGRPGEDAAVARSREYLKQVYGDDAKHAQGWRRIDTEWTGSVAELALRMDKFTNNTSLVLAIELVASGRVLLFPGDAQFGNWSSWDSVKFEGHPDVTAEDLLRRTVLYKVGHHGSHNATLKLRGLDRMTNPDLIAMIPVDEAFAHRQPGGGWKMPYPALYQDLKVRTQGRILRSDTGLPPASQIKSAVRSKFQKMVKVDELCVRVDL